MNAKLLEGKVALVTGASRGIGRGVAEALAREGARLAITARTMEPQDAPLLGGRNVRLPGSLVETRQAAEEAGAGAEALAVPADLADAESVQDLVQRTLEHFGRIDIVANCAMGFPEDYEGTAFWKSPVADWDAQTMVGVRSHYLISRFVAPQMVERGDGLIVIISAAGAIEDYYNVGFRVAHAANTRLAKAMAHDLKPHGVAALALWPRWVLTERVRLAVHKEHPGFHVEQSELIDADTPALVGNAIARLAVDPHLLAKSGRVQLIAELAEEYGLLDPQGRRPRVDDFTRALRKKVDQIEGALGW